MSPVRFDAELKAVATKPGAEGEPPQMTVTLLLPATRSVSALALYVGSPGSVEIDPMQRAMFAGDEE